MTKSQLVSVLQELADVSKSITSNMQALEQMKKYDIIFSGTNFNTIYSIELCHSVNNIFHIETSLDELNSMIPDVCNNLGMQYETMILAEKLPEYVLAGYKIEL